MCTYLRGVTSDTASFSLHDVLTANTNTNTLIITHMAIGPAKLQMNLSVIDNQQLQNK